MSKEEVTKDQPKTEAKPQLNTYYNPTLGCSVKAASHEEAVEKFNKKGAK